MRALSFQRFHWGLGAEDWRWIRWLWSRPGAQCLDLYGLQGFALWETDIARPEPLGIPLLPSRYASSRFSIHPGLHRLGPDEWYEEGLDELPDVGPDEFEVCEGVGWDSGVTVPVTVTLRAGLALDGGLAYGGEFTRPAAHHLTFQGGYAYGGEFTRPITQRLSLDGGYAYGGEWVFTYGRTLTLDGGLAYGGEAMLTHSGYVALEGGLAYGGEALLAPGQTLSLAGGLAFGGEITFVACGPVPLLSATSGPIFGADDFPTVPIPPGTQIGDLMLCFVVTGDLYTHTGLATGWSLALAGTAPAAGLRMDLFTARHNGLTLDFAADYAPAGEWAAAIMSFSNADGVLLAEFAGGLGASTNYPSIDVPAGYTLASALFTTAVRSAFAPADWVAVWGGSSHMFGWDYPGYPPGLSGGLSFSYTGFTGSAGIVVALEGYCPEHGRAHEMLVGGLAYGGSFTFTNALAPYAVSATKTAYTSSSTRVVTLPVAAVGDLLILGAQKVETTDYANPVGWTRLTSGLVGASMRYAVWYRFHVAGDASTVTLTWGGASTANCGGAVRVINAGTPYALSANTGTSTTPTNSGVSEPTAQAAELLALLFSPTAQVATDPSGMTPVTY